MKMEKIHHDAKLDNDIKEIKKTYFASILHLAYEEIKNKKKNETIEPFLNACRNWCSHEEHGLEQITNSFEELKKKNSHEKFLTELYKLNIYLYEKSEDDYILDRLSQFYTAQLKGNHPGVLFVTYLMASFMPSICINLLCDCIEWKGKEHPHKKDLIDLSKRNNESPDIDLAGFYWSVESENKENNQDQCIKKWNQHFMKVGWVLLFPEKDRERTIKIDNEEYPIYKKDHMNIRTKMDAITFRAKGKDSSERRFQMSRKLLQQILLNELKIKKDPPHGIDLEIKKKKEKNESDNAYRYKERLYSYYKSWTNKKAWVSKDYNGTEPGIRHKATKSLARYVIRDLVKSNEYRFPGFENTGNNKEHESLKQRKEYLNVFKVLQKNFDLSWKEEKKIDAGKIHNDLPEEFKALRPSLKLDNYFLEVFKDVCNKELEELSEGLRDQFDRFEKEKEKNNKRFKDFVQSPQKKGSENNGERLNYKEEWNKLTEKVPKIRGRRFKEENILHGLNLISSNSKEKNKPEKYLKPEDIDRLEKDYLEKFTKVTALYNSDGIKERFNRFNELLKSQKSRKENREKLDPAERNKNKEIQRHGYQALELGLLLIGITKRNKNLLEKLERLSLSGGKDSGKLYYNLYKNFYCNTNSAWIQIWNNSKKNNRENGLNSFEKKSDHEEKRDTRFYESFTDCKKTLNKKTVYILDNKLLESWLHFLLDKFKVFLNWESNYVESLSNEEKQRLLSKDGYYNFKALVENAQEKSKGKSCVKDYDQWVKVRNAIAHLDLLDLKTISDAASSCKNQTSRN